VTQQASIETRGAGQEAIVLKRITDELRAASDSEIEQAVQFVDPMVLRGLVYQLTGDEEIAATATASDWFFFFSLNLLADPRDVAMVQRRAAELLKAYRDQESDEVPLGPRERLPRSLGLTAGIEPDEPRSRCGKSTPHSTPWRARRSGRRNPRQTSSRRSTWW
jgi:4-hydroxyacetophenone monooxygenase